MRAGRPEKELPLLRFCRFRENLWFFFSLLALESIGSDVGAEGGLPGHAKREG